MYSAKALWPNRTCVARDGEEALEYLFGRGAYSDRGRSARSNDPPGSKTPQGRGLTVLRAIKNGLHTKVIPVVILTSSRKKKDVMNCYGPRREHYVQSRGFDHFRDRQQLCLYWLRVNQPQRGSVLGKTAERAR